MKWFKHDTNTRADEKIHKLILRHGAIGYAVYFYCLELIAGSIDNENFTFELKHDSELIADDLCIKGNGTESGQQIVENIMRTIVDLNLFEESQGHIYCMKLLSRIDTSMCSNAEFRTMIQSAKTEFKLEDNSAEQEEKTKTKRFVKPTIEEIKSYIQEKKLNVNPDKFYTYYESNGWKVGKNPMKNWKATLSRWGLNDYDRQQSRNKRASLVDQSGVDNVNINNVGF